MKKLGLFVLLSYSCLFLFGMNSRNENDVIEQDTIVLESFLTNTSLSSKWFFSKINSIWYLIKQVTNAD